MATVALSYAAPATITISPASTASSSTFVAGRESTQIDNTTNLYVDALVQGLVTVGTTPTANTVINVYVWGSDTSLATTAIDVLDGTDSAETLTNVGILASALRLAASAYVTATTSDLAYPISTFSVAALFGGVMPRFWGLFVAHNTAVNLNATGGNHVFQYTGIKYTVA
jgi:hypothetical protein